MEWCQIKDEIIVGIGVGVLSSLATHFTLRALGRNKARRELVCKRIEALEERVCAWLEILPENGALRVDAVEKRLFEVALMRLRRKLDNDQMKALFADCPDLENFGDANNARR